MNRPQHLVQISDCHLSGMPGKPIKGVDPDQSLLQVIDIVKACAPDYCIVTGDLSDDGSVAAYRRLSAYLQTLNIPVGCLPGNHDDPRVMRQQLPGGQVAMPGQACLGAWQLILLDSTSPGRCGGYLDEATLSALEAHLSREQEHHILVALHHPVLPSACDWLDQDMLLDNPADLLAILGGSPLVKAVVWGHIHQDFHACIRGLSCWAVPSTSVQFLPRSRGFLTDERMPGLRHLWLYPDGRIDSAVQRIRTKEGV